MASPIGPSAGTLPTSNLEWAPAQGESFGPDFAAHLAGWISESRAEMLAAYQARDELCDYIADKPTTSVSPANSYAREQPTTSIVSSCG